MAKITEDDIYIIDDFVNVADGAVKDLKHYSGYMRFKDKEKEIVVTGFNILKEKIKQMKNAKTIPELKKVLKIKKVIKNKGEIK